MTSEEFRNLKTGTGDPITPENLLARCLWRLEDLKKQKRLPEYRTALGETEEDRIKRIDTCISEIKYLLSVTDGSGEQIMPTHYYG